MALRTKWSPANAPATAKLRLTVELAREKEDGDVQEDHELTLDAWVGSDWTEVGGGNGELPRSAAAVVGEDEQGGDDPGLPSSIPRAGKENRMRR